MDKSDSVVRLAAALSLVMNDLPCISSTANKAARNAADEPRLSMLARKAPSSRLEIAAPIWRVKTKTPLENETKTSD